MLGRALGDVRAPLRAGARTLSVSAKKRVERKLLGRRHRPKQPRPQPIVTRATTSDEIIEIVLDKKHPERARALLEAYQSAAARGKEEVRDLILGTAFASPVGFALGGKFSQQLLTAGLLQTADADARDRALDMLAPHTAMLATSPHGSFVLNTMLEHLAEPDGAAPGHPFTRHVAVRVASLPRFGGGGGGGAPAGKVLEQHVYGRHVVARCVRFAPFDASEPILAPLLPHAAALAAEPRACLTLRAALERRADGGRHPLAPALEAALLGGMGDVRSAAAPWLYVLGSLAAGAEPAGPAARQLSAALAPHAAPLSQSEAGSVAVASALHAAPPAERAALAQALEAGFDELCAHEYGCHALAALFDAPRTDGMHAVCERVGRRAIDRALVEPAADGGGGGGAGGGAHWLSAEARAWDVHVLCKAIARAGAHDLVQLHAHALPRVEAMARGKAGREVLGALLGAADLPAENARQLVHALAPAAPHLALSGHRGSAVVESAVARAREHDAGAVQALTSALRPHEARLEKSHFARRVLETLGGAQAAAA